MPRGIALVLNQWRYKQPSFPYCPYGPSIRLLSRPSIVILDKEKQKKMMKWIFFSVVFNENAKIVLAKLPIQCINQKPTFIYMNNSCGKRVRFQTLIAISINRNKKKHYLQNRLVRDLYFSFSFFPFKQKHLSHFQFNEQANLLTSIEIPILLRINKIKHVRLVFQCDKHFP